MKKKSLLLRKKLTLTLKIPNNQLKNARKNLEDLILNQLILEN